MWISQLEIWWKKQWMMIIKVSSKLGMNVLSCQQKDLIDDCQIDSARSVNKLKYKFMFQKKLSENADLSTSEVKAVELQLPILKKWADLTFLVLAALMKTFKEDSDEVATAMYKKYKIDFIQAGNLYVDIRYNPIWITRKNMIL